LFPHLEECSSGVGMNCELNIFWKLHRMFPILVVASLNLPQWQQQGPLHNEKFVSFHSNVLYHVLLLLVNVQGLSVITSKPTPVFLQDQNPFGV
jgi:hypothetical protein